MGLKITISIPQDLHEKMQKWRKSLNISRICQKCIREEISKKELFHAKMQEEKTILEIWENGNFETEGGQYQVGKEMGFAYAKNSPYHEIKSYEAYAEKWDGENQEVVEQFHYDLDIMSILANLGLVEEPVEPGEVEKERDSLPLTQRFDWGFMEGIIEYLREECSSVEFQKIALERDEKMRLAKDKNEQMKIFMAYRDKLLPKASKPAAAKGG